MSPATKADLVRAPAGSSRRTFTSAPSQMRTRRSVRKKTPARVAWARQTSPTERRSGESLGRRDWKRISPSAFGARTPNSSKPPTATRPSESQAKARTPEPLGRVTRRHQTPSNSRIPARFPAYRTPLRSWPTHQFWEPPPRSAVRKVVTTRSPRSGVSEAIAQHHRRADRVVPNHRLAPPFAIGASPSGR